MLNDWEGYTQTPEVEAVLAGTEVNSDLGGK